MDVDFICTVVIPYFGIQRNFRAIYDNFRSRRWHNLTVCVAQECMIQTAVQNGCRIISTGWQQCEICDINAGSLILRSTVLETHAMF